MSWIPVSPDTLPAPLDDVVISMGLDEEGFHDWGQGYLGRDGKWRRSGEDPQVHPTHWMPAPGVPA